jgi:hypothetical protein
VTTVYQQQLEQAGYRTLYYGHEAGIYNLPDEWIQSYQALDEGADGRPAAATWHALTSATNGSGTESGASSLILNSIQPALVERLATFVADVALLGPYAELSDLTGAQAGELLSAGPAVAEAYQRHLQTHSWYQHLRGAWTLLRQREQLTVADPGDRESLLSEVANAPEVLPENWRNIGQWTARGFTPPPWPGTAAHLRLGWIIRAGGKVWAPTTQQHNDAWNSYVQAARTGIDPRQVSHHVVHA